MNETTDIHTKICPKYKNTECPCKPPPMVNKGDGLKVLSMMTNNITPHLYWSSCSEDQRRVNIPSADTYGVLPLRYARPC